MASSKITDLTATSTLASGDLIPVVTDPSGSPATKKITLTNFYANVVVTAKFANSVTFSNTASFNSSVTANNLFISYRTTPSGSGDTVAAGKIWFDTNWLYVATATNVIKRVSLTVF